MSSNQIIIRQSGLRQIGQEETIAILDQEEQIQPRRDFPIDMQPFIDDVESGDWERQASFLREKAISIAQACDKTNNYQVHYFGLSEIPQVIAFGAHWGDERHVAIHEFNRDANSWEWPSFSETLSINLAGLPNGPKITASGIAVLRISISAEIADQDVNARVGTERLADVVLRPVGGKQPQITLVRSAKDLEVIRSGFRKALAALQEHFPNLDTLHLFVAAPNSVCFAIGQELKPRNFFPTQTYRYRVKPAEHHYQPAILILSEERSSQDPLTSEEIVLASHVRQNVWPSALESLHNYKKSLGRKSSPFAAWYSALQPQEAFSRASPFSNLPSLYEVLPDNIEVDTQPYQGDEPYRLDKDHNLWQLHDRLLAYLGSIYPKDDRRVLQIIRLFLLHEHLHDHHCLTAYTAREVGKFPNCLEHLDYAADTYALFHEFNNVRNYEISVVREETQDIQLLANLIEYLIKSFWAFERSAKSNEWEVRRVRRYLNWYWRHIQVKRATKLEDAIQVVSKPPKIEIAGLKQRLQGRRVIMVLDRMDPTSQLELGIVLGNEKLFRLSNSTNTDLKGLLDAFCTRDHEKICEFFRSAYEFAKQSGGACT